MYLVKEDEDIFVHACWKSNGTADDECMSCFVPDLELRMLCFTV